jgi:hypothetical protein
MKKNLAAQWAARAGATNKLTACWSIQRALNGDFKLLARQLRERRASPEEMEFAADLIEGKVKPRRPRRGQPSLVTNDEIAQAYFHLRARHPDWRQKQIIGNVVGPWLSSFESPAPTVNSLASACPAPRAHSTAMSAFDPKRPLSAKILLRLNHDHS